MLFQVGIYSKISRCQCIKILQTFYNDLLSKFFSCIIWTIASIFVFNVAFWSMYSEDFLYCLKFWEKVFSFSVKLMWIQNFPCSRSATISKLKSPVFPTIYGRTDGFMVFLKGINKKRNANSLIHFLRQ